MAVRDPIIFFSEKEWSVQAGTYIQAYNEWWIHIFFRNDMCEIHVIHI